MFQLRSKKTLKNSLYNLVKTNESLVTAFYILLSTVLDTLILVLSNKA